MTSDPAKMARGETRRDVGELFLSSSGRMSRGPFVGTTAVLVGLFWLYDLHVGGLARTATGWLVDLLLVFSACCVLSKRLHDRGRAGWWAGLALLAFHLAWPRLVGVAGWGVVGWGAVVVLGLFAIDLAILPGQRGGNRFGP